MTGAPATPGGNGGGAQAPADLDAALGALWLRHRDTNLERIGRLESTAAAVLRGALGEAQRSIGEQAAHKLAGSLGTFGFAEGSRLAKQIESMLRTGACDPRLLAEAVVGLRAALPEPQETGRPAGAAGPVTVLALGADRAFDGLYRQLPRGFRVVQVSDRQDWREELEQTHPDIVLVEVNTARHRGGLRGRRRSGGPAGAGTLASALQICGTLRDDPRWRPTPVMVLDAATARRRASADATVQAVFAAGADDLLSAPVTAIELCTRISARIDRRAAAGPGPTATLDRTGPTGDRPPRPVAAVSGTPAETSATGEGTHPAVAGDHADVVLVEDDDSVADVVEYALRLRGLRPYRISNGVDAVAELCDGSLRAKLILLDVGLPGLDGFGVLGRLRESGTLARTPVIMLTARSSETETLAALGLGAAEHLAKPFSVPILVSRIERALGHRD